MVMIMNLFSAFSVYIHPNVGVMLLAGIEIEMVAVSVFMSDPLSTIIHHVLICLVTNWKIYVLRF